MLRSNYTPERIHDADGDWPLVMMVRALPMAVESEDCL
jgi:hypothetical protein